ncbi:MAG: hypothetical protein ABS862_02130 [Carnobacterium inhibens]
MGLPTLLKIVAATDMMSMIILIIMWGNEFLNGYTDNLLFKILFILIGFVRVYYYIRKLKSIKI